MTLVCIRRAADVAGDTIENILADLHGPDVLVTEQFLRGADVSVVFDLWVAKEWRSVNAAPPDDSKPVFGHLYCPADISVQPVMPPDLSAIRVDAAARCREDILPGPLPAGMGYLCDSANGGAVLPQPFD
jgi:hypothetical protein